MDTWNCHYSTILFSVNDMSSSVDSAFDAARSKSGLVESNERFSVIYNSANLARTDLSME